MPHDAKLGMVLGVGLVIVVAVVFFRKEPPPVPAATPADPVPAASPTPPPARQGQPLAPAVPSVPTPVPTAPKDTPPAPEPMVRKHRVAEGDTLESLAQHYFQDAAKAEDIRRANPELPAELEALEPGTELVIPPAPDAGPSTELPQ